MLQVSDQGISLLWILKLGRTCVQRPSHHLERALLPQGVHSQAGEGSQSPKYQPSVSNHARVSPFLPQTNPIGDPSGADEECVRFRLRRMSTQAQEDERRDYENAI